MSGPPQHPITEEELHAYVDGRLSADRLASVQRYLDLNPAQAERVAAWSAQREALRAAFESADASPFAPRVYLANLIERRLRRPSPWPRAAAALVLALVSGGAIGWFAHTPSRPSRTELAMSLLRQEAVATHAVYVPDKRRPVELPGSERAHLSQWLSERLSRTVSPPELETLGFHLVGGRLLATERGGAAALFMYEDSAGHRISVIFRPMAPELHAERTDLNAGALNGCMWIRGGMGYAVVAALPDDDLDRIANRINTSGSDAG